jgi:pimeloyl-ACP methyl ester carboxylesterase
MERRSFLTKLPAAIAASSAIVKGQAIMREQPSDFDSNGVNIHYVVKGKGEPVILLHGFIFSIVPAWMAGGLFNALSQTNCVVAMDLRGHGESGKPHDSNRYGLEMVNDVLRLMDHLGFDRVHLVGYSLGGILACKCLEVAAARLQSVVLGGAAWVREGDSTYRSWTPLAEMLERVRPGETLSSHFWPDPNTRPPREVQDLVDHNDPAALAAMARGMLDVTMTEEVLHANRIPVLAICGDLDPVKDSVVAMKRVTANLTVQVVPGFDHNTLPGSRQFGNAIRTLLTSAKSRT